MTIKRKTGKEKQEQAKEEKKISAVVKSLQAKYQLTDKEMMVALKETKRLKVHDD